MSTAGVGGYLGVHQTHTARAKPPSDNAIMTEGPGTLQSFSPFSRCNMPTQTNPMMPPPSYRARMLSGCSLRLIGQPSPAGGLQERGRGLLEYSAVLLD